MALLPSQVLWKLLGIEIDDDLLRGLVEHREVHFHRELRGRMETLDVAADVQPSYGQAAVVAWPDHGQHVDQRQLAAEMVLGIVQDAAERRVGPAHHPFHAVGRADEVALVDAPGPARADEDVLIVVGHARHFVRHDLADREHEVVAAFPDQPIELGRPRTGPDPFRRVANKIGWDLANRNHVVPPVMLTDQPAGQGGEHPLELPVGHGDMRTQGRHDVGQPVAEIVIRHADQRPRHAVDPREIGRQGQNLLPRVKLFKGRERPARRSSSLRSVVGEPCAKKVGITSLQICCP